MDNMEHIGGSIWRSCHKLKNPFVLSLKIFGKFGKAVCKKSFGSETLPNIGYIERQDF